MYSYVKKCIPANPPEPEISDQFEQEIVEPDKKECKCFLDICQEKEVPEPEPEFQYGKYLIENITMANPPLLKVYYWEGLDIDGLNSKLSSNDAEINHSFVLYPRLLHSRPLKIVFWLRNQEKPLKLKVKRVKNCECSPKQTRVGFNQFRYLYHCPHRRLLTISQEDIKMAPNDLVALTVNLFFFFVGSNVVTNQIISCDGRVLTLNVVFDVDSFFKPEKCVLTKELVPVNIRSFKRFVQPIWIRNLTMCHLKFIFKSDNRGACLVTTSITVPCQSTWPLLIEYRASEPVNEIELMMNFEAISGAFKIKAAGVSGNHRIKYTCPVVDYESADCLYTICPNRLEIFTSFNKNKTALVCVTNHSQECTEFKFQKYVLGEYFVITFSPQTFRLKAHHSKLILVTIRTYERVLYFNRIPVIMEVHKVFDKGTRIAKELLAEVESIDDPKWAQDSYKQYCYLHMDIVIEIPPVPQSLDPPCCPVPPEEISRYTNMENECVTPPPATRNTIFEKLFFEYLADSDFLKNKEYSKEYKLQSYQELLGLPMDEEQFNKTPTAKTTFNTDKAEKAVKAAKADKPVRKEKTNKFKKVVFAIPSAASRPIIKKQKHLLDPDKGRVYKNVTNVLWRSCIEISKTWRFIPEDQGHP